ncbi:MAG: mechanosensitive ion channel [Akkermansiaceae bacterium]
MNIPTSLILGNATVGGIMETLSFNSIMNSLGAFGPYIVAIIIFFLGKFVAGVIRKLIVKLLDKTTLDEKFGKLIGNEAGFGAMFANVVYCLILIFVVILALDKAGMGDAVQPLRDMLDEFLGFIPNLLGAGVLAFIAIFGAKVVKMLLDNVLNGARLDARLGNTSGATPIASAISTFVFCFIILFFIPEILATLGLPQISEPIKDIVESILSAVPKIIVAAVILGIGFLIAQIAQKLVKNLLDASGANSLPAKVGLDVPADGPRSVSGVVSFVVMLTIIVMIVSIALSELDLPLLTGLTGGLMAGYLNILAAVIIFGFGLIASKFAYDKLSGGNLLLAKVVRVAILIMTGVVALQRSEIAPALTGLPFVAAVIALAFAFGVGGAIALGLGGKDYVSRWFDKKG